MGWFDDYLEEERQMLIAEITPILIKNIENFISKKDRKMNIGIERVCKYCSKVIVIGSPMMWDNQETYHSKCFKDMVWDMPIISPNMKNGSGYYAECWETQSPTFSAEGEGPNVDTIFYNEGTKPLSFETKPKRIPWNQYFMEITEKVSSRSTCDRKHCGVLVVKGNRIYGHGYNGSNPGEPHCDDVGHFIVNNSCKRTIHAEINALEDAKTKLTDLKDCILYTNTYPCIACYWAIMKSGIKQIYYKDSYAGYVPDKDMEKISEAFDIKIEKVEI